jgi:hypothetical protein
MKPRKRADVPVVFASLPHISRLVTHCLAATRRRRSQQIHWTGRELTHYLGRMARFILFLA